MIADQITKGAVEQNFTLYESVPVIDGFFNLTYVRNTGAAWGVGQGVSETKRIIFFLIIPVLLCFWLIYLFFKSLAGKYYMSLAYALILAGAAGNLIDRFSLGYVVDFLDFYYNKSHFPAFNIADSSITIAAFLLIYDYFEEIKANKKQVQKT